MNVATDPIFAGVAGIRIAGEPYDLGEGVVLSKTSARFEAPIILRCEPEQPFSYWHGVRGGVLEDIHVQLFVPPSLSPPPALDRLNLVWWIAALIRLRVAPHAHVPIIADRPFAEIPAKWEETVSFAVEFNRRHVDADSAAVDVRHEDLAWLRSVWMSGARLLGSSAAFATAFQALDHANAMPTRGVAVLAIWGALEHLFSPAKQELRFRVAANIAAYLERPGEARLRLFRSIVKLYDARSSVAHGIKNVDRQTWAQTHALAARILNAIIEGGRVPSRDDLEMELFSPTN